MGFLASDHPEAVGYTGRDKDGERRVQQETFLVHLDFHQDRAPPFGWRQVDFRAVMDMGVGMGRTHDFAYRRTGDPEPDARKHARFDPERGGLVMPCHLDIYRDVQTRRQGCL